MEFKELVELFEKCGYTVRGYTGRHMAGITRDRQCLAIDSGNANAILDVIHELCTFGSGEHCANQLQKVQEVSEMLRDARVDSLGKGEITYWPSIAWEEIECDRDYDSDDLENLDQSIDNSSVSLILIG